MITNNPFSTLAEIVPAIAMQGFVIAMAALTLVGVLVDILHKNQYGATHTECLRADSTQRHHASRHTTARAQDLAPDPQWPHMIVRLIFVKNIN